MHHDVRHQPSNRTAPSAANGGVGLRFPNAIDLLPRMKRLSFCAGAVLAVVGVLTPPARAQNATVPATQPASASSLVTMDFPADGIEVTLLAEIVTKRLHIPILYDEATRGKKVIIRVPVKVPESALMGILQSALRMKQLALVDAELPGWKQIVPAIVLAGVATPADGAKGDEGPIAQVFVLSHNDPSKMVEAIRPFLTTPGGYIQAETGQRVLIVGDYPSVLKRVEPLIRKLDQEAPPVEVKFVPLKQAEAATVAPAVTQLLASRESYQWGSANQSGISLSPDERTNQIAVIAPPTRMADVIELISALDKAPQLESKVYRLKVVSPERLDRVVKGLIGASAAKHAYQSVVDPDSQTLVVAATPEIHRQIEQVLPQVDTAAPESQNPIQFYKLKNTKAADVLATISGLLGESASTEGPTGTGPENATQPGGTRGNRGEGNAPGNPPSGAGAGATGQGSSILRDSGSQLGATGGLAPQSGRASATGTDSSGGLNIGNSSNIRYTAPAISKYMGEGSSQTGAGVTSVRGRDATVAADSNTNSIIVVAPPNIQQMYADLIKRLDERRPQVQIECTIVTLDTTNGFNFGVDIGRLGGFDASQILTLSSFGVSTVDPKTGSLTPVNKPGGTFALLSPHIADIVINALATNSHAKLLSAPQLLVNDNGKGKLESVAQEPFAVILDASSTQSLTSLGGQAQAGTSITVEPHISEADYLQLGYSIELSNFTGTASNGLPPPSQKNAVDSSVTIPDGYTIVVGGLTTRSFNESVNTIPVLGDIPVLRWLFGSRSKTSADSTLFVFIRPVILRDDKFEDLKHISRKSAKAAGIGPELPVSYPVPMK
jgi:general secretion pathway protein D